MGWSSFDQPVALPDGIDVRVEPVPAPAESFWNSLSLDELARRQGASVPASVDDSLGCWPDDELNDGFDNALVHWREQEGQDSA